MKTVFMLLMVSMIFMGCAMTAQPADFSGSWIATGTNEMSMLVFHGDGTCVFYKKVGSPYAATWEGLWASDGMQIFILDAKDRSPVTVANIAANSRFSLFMFQEIYYFHRYGTGPGNGGL